MFQPTYHAISAKAIGGKLKGQVRRSRDWFLHKTKVSSVRLAPLCEASRLLREVFLLLARRPLYAKNRVP